MIEIKTKLRKWGNSLGIVVPLNALKKENMDENDEVIVLLTKKRKNILRETFGTAKFSKPTEQLMRETDEELYDN